MAIIFELVINFGAENHAAEDALRLVRDYPTLKAGDHQLRLREPHLSSIRGLDDDPYLEMSIIPERVSWGIGGERLQDRIPLTAAEFSELGDGLYGLLRQVTGYRAAQVGWDPEGQVDLAELEQEWAEEIAAGRMDGIVLADSVHGRFRSDAFVPFTAGYVWIPYLGQRPSTLTADGQP